MATDQNATDWQAEAQRWQARAGQLAIDQGVAQDDLAAILRELGIGDHARPQSPHQVVQELVLPTIRAWRMALAAAGVPTTAEHEEQHRRMAEQFRQAGEGETGG